MRFHDQCSANLRGRGELAAAAGSASLVPPPRLPPVRSPSLPVLHSSLAHESSLPLSSAACRRDQGVRVSMRATYLTGETVYLRALTKADAQVAQAWRQSPFPISQFQAEKQLEEMHKNPWEAREFLFALCR